MFVLPEVAHWTLYLLEHECNTEQNKEGSASVAHVLSNTHCYGKMGGIVEKSIRPRKGGITNIKENFYIYLYKPFNLLANAQKQRRRITMQLKRL
jgi:hypothetical protein